MLFNLQVVLDVEGGPELAITAGCVLEMRLVVSPMSEAFGIPKFRMVNRLIFIECNSKQILRRHSRFIYSAIDGIGL